MKTKTCRICGSFFLGIHEHVCDKCFERLIKEQEEALKKKSEESKGD